ncbi:MAG: hypothetical protein C0402_02825 [Thermodesulfovibrio sp.]|nr:hypothetical protein [Thermodesulfovibrio sp.]
MTRTPAKKLTVYLDETDRHGGAPLYEVLLELFYRNKLSGASVFRGVAGYGGDGVFHTAKILELSTSLPIRIDVVDTEARISAVLPEIRQLVSKGLIELTDTEIIVA